MRSENGGQKKEYAPPKLTSIDQPEAKRAIGGLWRKLEAAEAIDPRTGLYTEKEFRRLVLAELATLHQAELEGGHRLPITIVYLDIDYLKTKINDVHGHPAGNRAIIAVADEIRSIFRRGGDVRSRFHGDEFVVAASGDPKKVFLRIEERMKEISGNVNIAGNHGSFTIKVEGIDPQNDEFQVTVSLGMAVCEPKEDETVEKALDRTLKEADKQMYLAKGDKAR